MEDGLNAVSLWSKSTGSISRGFVMVQQIERIEFEHYITHVAEIIECMRRIIM